jgi:hypothetical protein
MKTQQHKDSIETNGNHIKENQITYQQALLVQIIPIKSPLRPKQIDNTIRNIQKEATNIELQVNIKKIKQNA